MAVAKEKLTWLESSFTFYASYHDEFVNQLIHIIFVWPIYWTAILFASYTDSFPGTESINALLPEGHICNFCLVATVVYFTFYLVIEFPGVVGPLASALTILTYFSVQYVKETYGMYEPWKLALAVHIFAWVAQIYGHVVHEGRSPAFLTNIFQAFMMAPLFVLMEVFFKFGYKPDFQKKIAAEVRKIKASFEKKGK